MRTGWRRADRSVAASPFRTVSDFDLVTSSVAAGARVGVPSRHYILDGMLLAASQRHVIRAVIRPLGRESAQSAASDRRARMTASKPATSMQNGITGAVRLGLTRGSPGPFGAAALYRE